jgi:hypothetical protein
MGCRLRMERRWDDHDREERRWDESHFFVVASVVRDSLLSSEEKENACLCFC